MGLVGLLMQKQNKTVGMKLLVASLAMFTLPITAYFLVFDWLGYSFHYAAAAGEEMDGGWMGESIYIECGDEYRRYRKPRDGQKGDNSEA